MNASHQLNPLHALAEGDVAKALAAFETPSHRLDRNPQLLTYYLSLAMALNDRQLVQAIVDRPNVPDEARLATIGQKISLARRSSGDVGEAIEAASKDMKEGEAERIASMVQGHISDSILPRIRHIAICGMAFCGSTLLDRMLGSIDGVAAIGESHWLTKYYDGKAQGPIDITRIQRGTAPMCARCGEDCKFLTPEFRTHLALFPDRWYDKIATQLQTSTLVSADKNMPKLLLHDPLIRFRALIVFKSPAQAWLSKFRKLPAGMGREQTRHEFDTYIDLWVRSYNQFLNGFAPRHGKVFLDFDSFTRNPEKAFRKLLNALDLPFDHSVLQKVKSRHSIGGNSQTVRSLRSNEDRVNITPRADDELEAEHREWLYERRDAQELFISLRAGGIRLTGVRK